MVLRGNPDPVTKNEQCCGNCLCGGLSVLVLLLHVDQLRSGNKQYNKPSMHTAFPYICLHCEQGETQGLQLTNMVLMHNYSCRKLQSVK